MAKEQTETKSFRTILKTAKPLLGTSLCDFETGVTGTNPHAGAGVPLVTLMEVTDIGVTLTGSVKGKPVKVLVPFANIVEFVEMER